MKAKTKLKERKKEKRQTDLHMNDALFITSQYLKMNLLNKVI